MRNLTTTALVACFASTSAFAAGLDRSGQSVSALFAEGRHLEFSIGSVSPSVSGSDGTIAVPGVGVFPAAEADSGNVGDSYMQFSAAYKADVNDQISYALIFDQPYGANVTYGSGSILYSGLEAEATSQSLTALMRYKVDGGFSVHGGVRATQIGAEVTLAGQAYGSPYPVGGNGYEFKASEEWEYGYVAGIAYERPEIALRVALTYSSAIDFKLDTEETGPALPAALSPLTSETDVTAPASVNLDFQSGIAEDTLVFGSIRYVEWDGFEIQPANLPSPLVSYENDSMTYTLGVGRRFTDQFSGAVTLGWEQSNDDPVSALGPTDGFTSVGLGGTYKVTDSAAVTAGLRYIMPGDADVESGAGTAEFTDNSVLAFGLKVELTL